MQVGIVELMETGHIVLAETLARIFCSDPGNSITIYTTEKHAGSLGFLCSKLPNLAIAYKPRDLNYEKFLSQIAEKPHDRVYIITINSLFREFAGWQINSPVFPVIHNLDEWFGISASKRIMKFLNAAVNSRSLNSLIYSFKVYFINHPDKKNILEKVRRTSGKIVVLSEAVEKQLIQVKPALPSEVIPFSVFDPSLVHERPDPHSPLRFCVPGILSQYRRNYMGLMDLIENNLSSLKDRFIIDFLGGVQPENPLNQCELLLKRAETLKQKGFSIIIHSDKFIPPDEYDRDLAGSDIILGNMNVVLNRYSQYGKTKETGLPFAMIKAGKPGILPAGYPVPRELRSGVLTYNSYDELGKIIAGLIDDRLAVTKLQEAALSNSRLFSPEVIYKKLVS